jgi:DNA-directed RNA polymerase II subunit RPB2
MSATSDLPFRVLNAYYEQTDLFLTRHHIDSYEHFVFNELPQMIYSGNPATILKDPLGEGKYKYKTEIFFGGKVNYPSELRIQCGSPIITLDSGKTVRRMYPNEARLRGLTYYSQIRMDIDIEITRTVKRGETFQEFKTLIPIKNFSVLKLPILLRSRLCSLGVKASDVSMKEKGESPFEHGGYFIIDGAEKILITRQEQAFNSLYVARKNPTDLDVSVYASVVSQHPETKMNRRCSVYMLRENSVLRVSIPSVRGKVPLFVLFRALGIESDKDIVRMIFPDTDSKFTDLYEDILIPSIEDAWPITTQAMAIHFIATLTHQGTVASVLDILRNNLLSHVPNKFKARAYYLGDMVQKIIKVNARISANTDRDDIRNQRLLTTGTLVRDLFGAVWKDWKKMVQLSVDKKYNYNTTLYEGEKFQDIFAAGNILEIFQVDELNAALMRGFRGKWGTNQFDTKTGVLQPLARISYLDAMSHCRRVLLEFDTSMKQRGPRHLHASQLGYFCTNETPTGAHIGVSKNYSMMTNVSIAAKVKPVLEWLEKRGNMVSIELSDKRMKSMGFLVRINGGTIGFVEEPQKLVRVLKLMKWTAFLPPMCSISYNTTDREINIYLDEGRPTRPLWHLESGGQWTPLARTVMDTPGTVPNWRQLVLGTHPATASRAVYDVEFIDPLKESPNPSLDEYIDMLTPHMGAIEYVDPYETNEAFISWWGSTDLGQQHTHVEIHPSTMSGLMVSLIPFYNHNQSPRNQLSCSQSKQGIGYYATNFLERYDTYGSQLCYGEAPLVRSIVQDNIAKGMNSYGYNCIVAMASTDGYNQDDGILFNRSSVERGLFRHLALRSYEGLEEVDSISKVVYKIANPKLVTYWTDLKPGNDYSKLDENGIITVGSTIDDNTVLVGRYMENPETHETRDASILPTIFTKGRVESVVLLNQANGMRLVRVRILQERIPELGDKFGSRHGQKGTMGMLIPAENMPHTREGIIPDIVVNPHGLTSRMTVAQLIECLFGRMGAEVGAKCNGTAFCNREDIVKTVGESLETIGLHPHSENIMYCGTTGKQLQCNIFMGPLYFMRMKHLTSDKINSRGEGRREVRTHQPTGGRGNEGGMRIGEMERDAVLAHGTTLFLQESMMKRSDATSFWVCNGCGTIPISNERDKLFICPTCDGPVDFSGTTAETLAIIQPLKRSRVTFSKVEMPYALKVLDQELTTFTTTGLRFITSKTVGRLNDSVLDWKQVGSGIPEAPLATQQLLKVMTPETNTLVTDDGPTGVSSEQTYAQYGGEEEALVADVLPEIESMPNQIPTAKYPINETSFINQAAGGDPVVIGEASVPNSINKIIDLKQTGGGYTDTIDLEETTSLAPIESIGKDSELAISQTGGVQVESIDKNILETDTQQIVNDRPIKSILKKTPDINSESLTSPQVGGVAPLQTEPPLSVDFSGTDIKPITFAQPQMGSEPFVIANPFTSPPVEQALPKLENIEPGAPALTTQPVGVAEEITNTVKVFENADIRVIKLS